MRYIKITAMEKLAKEHHRQVKRPFIEALDKFLGSIFSFSIRLWSRHNRRYLKKEVTIIGDEKIPQTTNRD